MNEKPLISSESQSVTSLADETRYAANGIVSRTVLRTQDVRVILFGFAAGQELEEHTSTLHALVQILSGACEFSLDGKPHNLKPNDLVYMPPNLPHALRATDQLSMLLTLFKPTKPTAPRDAVARIETAAVAQA